MLLYRQSTGYVKRKTACRQRRHAVIRIVYQFIGSLIEIPVCADIQSISGDVLIAELRAGVVPEAALEAVRNSLLHEIRNITAQSVLISAGKLSGSRELVIGVYAVAAVIQVGYSV